MSANTRHVTWLTLLALAACDTGGGGDGASAEDAGGADAGQVDLDADTRDAGGPVVLDVPWRPDATAEWIDERTLIFTVPGPAEWGPYRLGLVEGDGGEIWEGEDCIPGASDGYDICHPVPRSGILTLTSIHPDVGGSIDQFQEAVTTLMYEARAPGLTYVLIRATEQEECWTWGLNPQHYIDAAGCELLE